MSPRKKITGTAIAAGAVFGLVVSATGSAQAATHPDQAYGLRASLVGHEIVAPTPYVHSTDGSYVEKALIQLPPSSQDNPLKSLSARNPLASLTSKSQDQATLGAFQVNAKAGAAEARAVHLNLGGKRYGITADVIDTTSEGGDSGSVRFTDLNLFGVHVGDTLPAPNTADQTIGVDGILKITYNEQIRNDDGSLTVEGLHVEVLPGTTGPQLHTLTKALKSERRLDTGSGMTTLSQLDLKPKLENALERLAGSSARKAVDPSFQHTQGRLIDVVVTSATSGQEIANPSPTPTESTPGDDGGDNGDNGDNDGDNAPTPTPVHTNAPVTG